MSTTIGGTTVADPLTPGPAISRDIVGEYARAHDGTLLLDYTAVKRIWALEWELLTQSQRDTLMTKLTTVTSQSLSPPHEASSYTILVDQTSIEEETQYLNGTSYYNIRAELKEV